MLYSWGFRSNHAGLICHFSDPLRKTNSEHEERFLSGFEIPSSKDVAILFFRRSRFFFGSFLNRGTFLSDSSISKADVTPVDVFFEDM